jgi:hypothetical protein
VSELLWHASVVMSERYAHLAGPDSKAAVDLKSVLQSGTPGDTPKSESLSRAKSKAFAATDHRVVDPTAEGTYTLLDARIRREKEQP